MNVDLCKKTRRSRFCIQVTRPSNACLSVRPRKQSLRDGWCIGLYWDASSASNTLQNGWSRGKHAFYKKAKIFFSLEKINLPSSNKKLIIIQIKKLYIKLHIDKINKIPFKFQNLKQLTYILKYSYSSIYWLQCLAKKNLIFCAAKFYLIIDYLEGGLDYKLQYMNQQTLAKKSVQFIMAQLILVAEFMHSKGELFKYAQQNNKNFEFYT